MSAVITIEPYAQGYMVVVELEPGWARSEWFPHWRAARAAVDTITEQLEQTGGHVEVRELHAA